MNLHIFEPRYVKMLKDCIEFNTGFGVVCLKSGREVLSESNTEEIPQISKIGTLANVARYDEVEADRFNIEIQGVVRFRLDQDWENEDRLRIGHAEFLNDGPDQLVEVKDLPNVSRLFERMSNMDMESSAQLNRPEYKSFDLISLLFAYLGGSIPPELWQGVLESDSMSIRMTNTDRLVGHVLAMISGR